MIGVIIGIISIIMGIMANQDYNGDVDEDDYACDYAYDCAYYCASYKKAITSIFSADIYKREISIFFMSALNSEKNMQDFHIFHVSAVI